MMMAAYADDPVVPQAKLCSIQASGAATIYESDGTKFVGTVEMKRVNKTAIMNFRVSAPEVVASGALAVRPDFSETCFSLVSDQGQTTSVDWHSSFGRPLTPGNFKYEKDYKPFPDKDYVVFSVIDKFSQEREASLLFTNDGNLDLAGEIYFIGDGNATFIYAGGIKDYEHNQVDHVFSIDNCKECSKAATDAPWALTSACQGGGGGAESTAFFTVPSFILLVFVAIALALF